MIDKGSVYIPPAPTSSVVWVQTPQNHSACIFYVLYNSNSPGTQLNKITWIKADSQIMYAHILKSYICKILKLENIQKRALRIYIY